MRRALWFTAIVALLLPSGLWAATHTIDRAHSSVEFTIRHLGISKVKGNFGDFAGTLVFDEDAIEKGSVSVTIQTSSIDTGNENRDKHLRSADFFDVEKYPTITFESTKVEKSEEGWILHGNLTMHGVTREVAIPFEVLGVISDPQLGTRAGFEGSLTIQRETFGVGWEDMKFRPPLIGNDVEISLNLETIQQEQQEK